MVAYRIVLVSVDEHQALDEDLGSMADAKAEARHISTSNPGMDVIVQRARPGGGWEDAWRVRAGRIVENLSTRAHAQQATARDAVAAWR